MCPEMDPDMEEALKHDAARRGQPLATTTEKLDIGALAAGLEKQPYPMQGVLTVELDLTESEGAPYLRCVIKGMGTEVSALARSQNHALSFALNALAEKFEKGNAWFHAPPGKTP